MHRLHTLLVLLVTFLAFPAVAFAAEESVTGDQLGDLGSWAVISGALLPFLIGVVVQQKWSSGMKAGAAAAIAVLDALVVTYFEHGLHLDSHFMVTAGLVFVTAQTTYRGLWKPTLGVGGGSGLSPISEKGVDPQKLAATRTGQ